MRLCRAVHSKLLLIDTMSISCLSASPHEHFISLKGVGLIPKVFSKNWFLKFQERSEIELQPSQTLKGSLWPRSAPSIPQTFFKSGERHVSRIWTPRKARIKTHVGHNNLPVWWQCDPVSLLQRKASISHLEHVSR